MTESYLAVNHVLERIGTDLTLASIVGPRVGRGPMLVNEYPQVQIQVNADPVAKFIGSEIDLSPVVLQVSVLGYREQLSLLDQARSRIRLLLNNSDVSSPDGEVFHCSIDAALPDLYQADAETGRWLVGLVDLWRIVARVL